jgi:polysaccharide deacetylase 2 family uncharacterized protein YibQ
MPPKKSSRSNRKRKKTPAKPSRFPLFRTLLWIAVAAVGGLTLFILLRLSYIQPSPDVKPPVAAAKAPTRLTKPKPAESKTTHPVVSRPPASTKAQAEVPPTYEAEADDFEAKVRQVDLAILQTLNALGRPQSALRHRAVEARRHNGQEFFYQNLTIDRQQDIFPFLAALRKNLAELAPEAGLATLNENPRDLEISIFGEPTHHLFLPRSLSPEEPKAPAATPKMVIVIDDLGASMPTARRLAALPFPVTFSVLPYNSRARDVAGLARKKNLELLLHLPCEPEGYPHKANSGPGTLRVNMSSQELEQTLAANLARLPEVDGANNHMGSKLTQSKKAMRIVLAHLKGRGKFFLDSVTTPKSCVPEVSKALGMRYYRRHIFLDNTPQEHAILLQLKKAETLARKKGLTVVIGHPYPATLSALETWAKTRDTRIHICKLQDL